MSLMTSRDTSSQDYITDLSQESSLTSPDSRLSDEETSVAEYIIYLEPSSGSSFAAYLDQKRSFIVSEFGADPSNQYHPHCSLTGFISLPADASKAVFEDVLVEAAATLVPDTEQFEVHIGSAARCRFAHCVKGGLVARNGSLVMPLTCIDLAARLDHLCQKLQAQIPDNEIQYPFRSMLSTSTLCSVDEEKPSLSRIRKKRADHVSLASSRTSCELEELCRLFSKVEIEARGARWDVVVRERVEKGKGGGPHWFREVHRFTGVGVCTP